MIRQVENVLSGQALYPARWLGFSQRTIVGIISFVCLSAVACQPLPVPAEGAGSETTLPAEAAAPSDAEEQEVEEQEVEEQEAEEQEAAASEESATEEDSSMIELSEPEQMLFDLAAEDLSAELGISPDEISVSSVQAVDFPDASLGCPEEGMMYAQVITPGYALILEADGTEYEYHGTDKANGHVVRCEPSS